MLNLKQKACHLAKAFPINSENHGDELVGTVDIPLRGIMLGKAELDELLGDGSHSRLFRITKNNREMPEVFFGHFGAFSYKQKFRNAVVTLHVGLGPEKLKFADCNIGSIGLEPKEGGMTQLRLTVRARPEPEQVATLFPYRETNATVWISGAEIVESGENQTELPLGEKVGGNEDESSE